jgi:superfamily II helicase
MKNENLTRLGKKFSYFNNIEEKSQKDGIKNKYGTNNLDDDAKNSQLIIETLKENIKSIKKENKIMHQNFTENISQRNEAQQLIQKCIADIKFDINKVNTDVSNLQKKSSIISVNEKLKQELKMKKHHLSSLENKLKILTFVYDNGFSSNNFQQNKLISPIFKK